jgi:hypothetical protein
MITIIARWDRGWNEPKSEAFIFRQVARAYDCDRLIFVGPIQEDDCRVEQMSTMEEALESAQGARVFLEPTGEKTLNDIPEGDVVLIFGCTTMHNLRESKPEERYRFKMAKPEHKGIFAITAVGIVLAHRFGQ